MSRLSSGSVVGAPKSGRSIDRQLGMAHESSRSMELNPKCSVQSSPCQPQSCQSIGRNLRRNKLANWWMRYISQDGNIWGWDAMTNAKVCLQSTFYRSFLIACFAILFSVFSPYPPQAQQSPSVPQTVKCRPSPAATPVAAAIRGRAARRATRFMMTTACRNALTAICAIPVIPAFACHHAIMAVRKAMSHVPLPSCPDGYHRNLQQSGRVPARQQQLKFPTIARKA